MQESYICWLHSPRFCATVHGTRYNVWTWVWAIHIFFLLVLLPHLQNGANMTFSTYFKRYTEETNEIMHLIRAMQVKHHLLNQHKADWTAGLIEGRGGRHCLGLHPSCGTWLSFLKAHLDSLYSSAKLENITKIAESSWPSGVMYIRHLAEGIEPTGCLVKCIITTAVITIIADIQEKLVSIDALLNVLLPLKRTSWRCPPFLTNYLHFANQIQYHEIYVFCYSQINPCL